MEFITAFFGARVCACVLIFHLGTQGTINDSFVFYIYFKKKLLSVCACAHTYQSIYKYVPLELDRYMKVKDG